MNRIEIDQFVWLHGGRVISRKPKGKGEFVVSDRPLSVEPDMAKFNITVAINGIARQMQAVRTNNCIVCWEVQ